MLFSKGDINWQPLSEVPELNTFKEKYKNRSVLWTWVLTDGGNLNVGIPIDLEMYRLALGVYLEDKQTVPVEERRQAYRKTVRKLFNKGKIRQADLVNLNSILLNYCCTYDGPKKLLNDASNPEIGIMVHQDVLKMDDLLIWMTPKEYFIEDYNRMVKEKRSFINFVQR